MVDYFNSKNFACASALPAHHEVGPQGPFQAESSFILERSAGSAYSTVRFCPWAGPESHQAYLGVKFNIGGEIHYGWIRRAVDQFSSDTITGYAYETVPNKSISTGITSGPVEASLLAPMNPLPSSEPLSAPLGVLALGNSGLTLWRREQTEQVPGSIIFSGSPKPN